MLLNNGSCDKACVYKTPYGFCQLTCCFNYKYRDMWSDGTDYTTSHTYVCYTEPVIQYDKLDEDYGVGKYS